MLNPVVPSVLLFELFFFHLNHRPIDDNFRGPHVRTSNVFTSRSLLEKWIYLVLRSWHASLHELVQISLIPSYHAVSINLWAMQCYTQTCTHSGADLSTRPHILKREALDGYYHHHFELSEYHQVHFLHVSEFTQNSEFCATKTGFMFYLSQVKQTNTYNYLEHEFLMNSQWYLMTE